MMILARSRLRPEFGRCTEKWLRRRAGQRFLTAMILATAFCGLACGDDDPAPQTGIGGSSAGSAPDASVRDLPGEGREPTPDFDTESRQRTPIGPQELVENIEDIRNDNDGRGPADAGDQGLADADARDGGAS